MEKLYIKETRPATTKRSSTRNSNKNQSFNDTGKVRGCRSNSLKNRMLLITLNKYNKHEWLVLP